MGRLTALAAKALGYRVHVLESDASTTSEGVADRSVPSRLDDLRAVADVCRDARVVTTSVEQIPVFSLEAAAVFAHSMKVADCGKVRPAIVWPFAWEMRIAGIQVPVVPSVQGFVVIVLVVLS